MYVEILQCVSFDVMPNLQTDIHRSLSDGEVLAQRQDHASALVKALETLERQKSSKEAAVGTEREGILAKANGGQCWVLDCIV